MLKYLRRCFALRTELKALNAQIECGERPMLASPVEQKPGKLVWRIPIPGQSDAFVSIEAGHADYDRFVVPVHAAAFYRAWLAGGLQSSKRWDGCLLPSELATDYKYRHAVAGFAHGEQNPVPLARVGACYHKGTVKIGFTDGITRTFWLLANNVAAFPVMVADNRRVPMPTIENQKPFMIEQINWVSISDRLPDDDTTVLVLTPELDEPCWLGYFQGDKWFFIDGSVIGNNAVHCWAHMPGGPGSQPIY